MNVNQQLTCRCLAVLALVAGIASTTSAQIVACDFDVADDLGRSFTGSTAHITGLPGASTNRAQFFVINADKPEEDVDHDGYAPPPGCDYTDLYLPDVGRVNLINHANPSLAIPAANIILVNFPHRLATGTTARVDVYVEVPVGTPAGTYLGEFQIRDRTRGVAIGPNNEVLGLDRVQVEVTVLEDRSLALVNADDAGPLDSLVLRGRAGTTARGVFRIANPGNVALSDVRVFATDLRSESSVGIVIPASNVSFSAPSFASIGINDTVRVTVSVNIPRGILGGRYRGLLTVQGADTPPSQVPLILIVTSSRGIVFENNPVRNANGVARIAFNGDPGTDYKLLIFDMAGLAVYEFNGTVFAGLSLTGTPGTQQAPAPGADFAVNVIWPLTNGRGEGVASGMYLVVVESIVNGQRQLARDKLIVIR